ncbi:MAG: hypothetical protein ABSG41_00855 [Bryobacteraceae bacterium]|jgi:hypothetical protein
MITPGTILIEKGTVLPPSFRLESQPYAGAWMPVGGRSSHDVEHELTATGWTFFYMAGEVTAKACGFDRQKAVNTALNRLIASVRLQNCNCLEIDEVAMHSFLGMPYVSVSAHSCNIQKGPLFSGAISRDTIVQTR